MSKMIFIDGIIYSLQKAGGISVYFSEVVKRLDPRGYYFLLHDNDSAILQDYEQLDFAITSRRNVSLKLVRYLDVDLPNGVKVFHSSYYRLPKKKFRKTTKIITTVHDFTYEKKVGGWKALLHHWQKKRAVLNSDVVVCISENTHEDLLRYIPKAKDKDIRVIYNGVSDDFYPLKSEEGISCSENPYVLFVGSRGGYKNFLILVHAMKNILNVDLLVVGGGELSVEEGQCLEECLSGRYKIKSFVSNDNLNEFYNYAHCLVYPSLYEGFGMPAIEAMKAGCPVVAANASSLPEICLDSAVLLDNVTVYSIQEAIQKLMDAKFRACLIDRGFVNASRFSWDYTISQLEVLYLTEA